MVDTGERFQETAFLANPRQMRVFLFGSVRIVGRRFSHPASLRNIEQPGIGCEPPSWSSRTLFFVHQLIGSIPGPLEPDRRIAHGKPDRCLNICVVKSRSETRN